MLRGGENGTRDCFTATTVSMDWVSLHATTPAGLNDTKAIPSSVFHNNMKTVLDSYNMGRLSTCTEVGHKLGHTFVDIDPLCFLTDNSYNPNTKGTFTFSTFD